jgi:hypothetical protein
MFCTKSPPVTATTKLASSVQMPKLGSKMTLRSLVWLMVALGALPLATGCEDVAGESTASAEEHAGMDPVEPERHERVDSRPPPMHEPVDLWENGETHGQVDAADAVQEGHIVFDLGEEWTPYLFTTRGNATEEEVPNAYRATYLALARGELPSDHHGERARRDKYLELYGIMPTLGLLRERMRHVSGLECAASLDLQPLVDFDGFVTYRGNDTARRDSRNFAVLSNQIDRVLAAQHVESVDALDMERVEDRDVRRVRDFREQAPKVAAIRAAQTRLDCEGFFEGKGNYTRGAIDWSTHEALAEFERRHRVYGWGFIGKDTLDALRRSPMENEREAVIRILSERAMHAAGVIEDGSTATKHDGTPRTFRGADGTEHAIPNLEGAIREAVIAAFGLETPESTLAFLEGLGELPPDGERSSRSKAPTARVLRR